MNCVSGLGIVCGLGIALGALWYWWMRRAIKRAPLHNDWE